MQGFQGAVLRIKLRRLHAWTQKRREIAKEYRRMLEGARLEMPQDDPRDECVHHQFAICVKDRTSVIAQLAARGIDTAMHYPKPIHLQPAYSSLGYPAGTFPHAERACERVLSLPLFPGMTVERVNYVATSVLEIAGRK
jgi:dTDP-4-amino-4,6-dideoxygalactose transaminase